MYISEHYIFLESVKYMYHGSSIKGLKILEPSMRSVRDSKEGPVVFAAPNFDTALPFILPKGRGFNFGFWKDKSMYLVFSPKTTVNELKKMSGSIYTVSSEGFNCSRMIGLKELECINKNPVKVLKETKIPNLLTALVKSEIDIYFPDRSTWEEIKRSKDHGYSIIKKLKPYKGL